MDEVLCKNYPAPRMIMMSSPYKNQFFVTAENEILGEYPCFQDALAFCFAAYYVFHVEYPSQVKTLILYFLQDFVVRHPDSLNRNGTYLATTSDIKRHM